ncbi:MAG: hybrid sensor histidine kinase/response regulator [Pseudanabaena sp.]|nr:MAG: hybrid sensor histidine kinase/response regulator [Pseudanabaena sp.]
MAQILVIEDEELIRESLEDLLTVEGFSVITAVDGRQGVEIATNNHPDLIICDVMMPIMNGYQVLEEVRQQEHLHTVPFLFLTSVVDRHSNRRGMSLGADDYLEKPCSRAELMQAIAVRLDKQKAIKQSIENKMNLLRSNITLALPHELQTPLSGIMGLSELMMLQHQELTSEDIYEYAHDIYRSSERLHRLIQNYLFYSKLLLLRSKGQSHFSAPVSCNSQEVIATAAKYKAQESDRLADLEMNISILNTPISADDLTKIIEELIDNAFKYSPKHTKVSLRSFASQEKWFCTITDQGRGMSQNQIDDIGAYMQFGRQFYEQQGMGLGLSIAKTLVEFYGGNLAIASKEGVGTTMTITIPFTVQSAF